jgi:putative transposase
MWVSSKEAAEILGMNYQTLKKKVQRAKKADKKNFNFNMQIFSYMEIEGIGHGGKTLQIDIDPTLIPDSFAGDQGEVTCKDSKDGQQLSPSGSNQTQGNDHEQTEKGHAVNEKSGRRGERDIFPETSSFKACDDNGSGYIERDSNVDADTRIGEGSHRYSSNTARGNISRADAQLISSDITHHSQTCLGSGTEESIDEKRSENHTQKSAITGSRGDQNGGTGGCGTLDRGTQTRTEAAPDGRAHHQGVLNASTIVSHRIVDHTRSNLVDMSLPQAQTDQTLVSTRPVTDHMRATALARFDLLALWEGYIAHVDGLTKKEATSDFLSLYQSGAYPKIKKTLGKVSRSTLYNWARDLENGKNNYESLIPGYHAKGALEYESTLMEYEKAAMLALLLNENKLDIGQAMRVVFFELQRKGLEITASKMTYRRFAEHWMKTNYDHWLFAREGQKAVRDQLAPYLVRDVNRLEVGDVLVSDGHVLNFQVIDPMTGRPCRATLICYVDWRSRDIAGYHIMTTENTAVISAALRESILRLGMMPKAAYQDNGRAFRGKFFTEDLQEDGMGGVFAKLGIAAVFAKPYNARAKVVERFFREYLIFERLMPSYTGTHAFDKPASLSRNEKIHKAQRSDFIPTIAQVMDAMEPWLEFYRAQPCPVDPQGRSIGEVFESGRGSGVDRDRLDELMMKVEHKQVNRNGITLMGASYYHENLYAYRQRVQIRYSLSDISAIRVYDLRGVFLCEAKRIEAVHPMMVLGTASDAAAVKRGLAVQKRLEQKTVKAFMETKNPDVEGFITMKEEQKEEEVEQPKTKRVNYEDLINERYA